MRLFLILTLLPVAAFAQTTSPDPLAVTLPSGRVVHFETAEQKAKFETARQKAIQPAPSLTPTSAATSKTAEQLRADFDKRQAEQKEQDEKDRKSVQLYFKISYVDQDGVFAYWTSPGSGSEWSPNAIFITCTPEKNWAEHVVFFAKVYEDGVHKSSFGSVVKNYHLNGKVLHTY